MIGCHNAAQLSPSEEFKPFTGVDDYCFGWGGRVYEVHEDGDGYRSYVWDITDAPAERANRFAGRPVLANCKLVVFVGTVRPNGYDESVSMWRLVDESGHVWLEFGESSYDDYYPCFEWHYFAKPSPQPAHNERNHERER